MGIADREWYRAEYQQRLQARTRPELQPPTPAAERRLDELRAGFRAATPRRYRRSLLPVWCRQVGAWVLIGAAIYAAARWYGLS
jgi:hypothetical protein